MINYTCKEIVEKTTKRCPTSVVCDVCGNKCRVEPFCGEVAGVKCQGVVHAFRVSYDEYYDPDFRDNIYISEDDCCSTKCVIDLLNKKYDGDITLLENNDTIEINKVTYHIAEETNND